MNESIYSFIYKEENVFPLVPSYPFVFTLFIILFYYKAIIINRMKKYSDIVD